jgi:phosphoadenosine phosphosulfate reductase
MLDQVLLNAELRPLNAWQRIARVLEVFSGQYGEDRVLLSSSFGAGSAVLLRIVADVAPGFAVHFIDTGYHFPQTLAYRDELLVRLGLRLVTLCADEAARTHLRDELGAEPFVRNAERCCATHKVAPLRHALTGRAAWISGLRRAQTAWRAGLDFVEPAAEGRWKIQPLLDWSREDCEALFRERDLPRHPLEREGYPSIGCAPCTRPCGDSRDERAGRWAGQEKTECGLHLPGRGLS